MREPAPLIRAVTLGDAPEIAGIYAHHVLHGTSTFEEAPPDAGVIAVRIDRILERGWPYLVAEHAGAVAGYAYCAQFRERPAYRFAAEDSIYVREDLRGRGIGQVLLGALLETAAEQGFRQMIAMIGDAANTASIGLHTRLGFAETGRIRACGVKFGRWLDVVVMQRALGAGDTAPAS